jgi:hypothetical protein
MYDQPLILDDVFPIPEIYAVEQEPSDSVSFWARYEGQTNPGQTVVVDMQEIEKPNASDENKYTPQYQVSGYAAMETAEQHPLAEQLPWNAKIIETYDQAQFPLDNAEARHALVVELGQRVVSQLLQHRAETTKILNEYVSSPL